MLLLYSTFLNSHRTLIEEEGKGLIGKKEDLKEILLLSVRWAVRMG